MKPLQTAGVALLSIIFAPAAHADANSYLTCLSHMRIYPHLRIRLTSW